MDTKTQTKAEALVQLRKALGLNQSQFWSRLGITQSSGSRYESGRNVPKPVQLLVDLVYGDDAAARALLTKLRKGA